MRNGYNQLGFDNFVIDCSIIGFEDPPVELKSGRLSHFYVDWRKVLGTVDGVQLISGYILGFAKLEGLEPNCYYGVPAGAPSLGVVTQYRWVTSHEDFMERHYPLSVGRENPKDHGKPKDKYFVGMPEGKTVVIEDTVTTGGSLIKEITKLLETEIDVKAAIVLTDRNEKRADGSSVAQAVRDLGVDYYTMSSALELLPIAYQRQKIGKRIGRKIEDEFREFGVKALKIA
jgi:orotate phosphoribosyltransferase